MDELATGKCGGVAQNTIVLLRRRPKTVLVANAHFWL